MWLRIEELGKSRFTMMWGDSRGLILDYTIGQESVLGTADKIRAQLSELSSWSEAGGNDATERRALLVKLAELGESLRFHLFYAPDRASDVKKLRQRIREAFVNDRELSIQVDTTIHIPWGLVFEGDVPPAEPPAADPATEIANEITRFRSFWALKYSLSATVSGNLDSPARMTRPRESFGLLSLLNSDVLLQIKSDVGDSEYSDFLGILDTVPVGIANTVADCERLIECSKNQPDILFNILGHHSDATLELGGGQVVSFSKYLSLMDSLAERNVRLRDDSSPCNLLFLNACGSATGKLDLSLRASLARSPTCGAIATESIVSSEFAAKFGKCLLEALVKQGKSVAEAMDELHHDGKLWPQSLLYGCYADPYFRIEKPT